MKIVFFFRGRSFDTLNEMRTEEDGSTSLYKYMITLNGSPNVEGLPSNIQQVCQSTSVCQQKVSSNFARKVGENPASYYMQGNV